MSRIYKWRCLRPNFYPALTFFVVLIGFLANPSFAQEQVQMVLFTPIDVSAPTDARQKLTAVADATEKFFFQWMNHWGYSPGATNLFRRKPDGLVDVLQIQGDKPGASGNYAKPNFADEVIKLATDKYKIAGKYHVWWIFVYLGDRPARFDEFGGIGNPAGGGWAMVNYDTLPGEINPGQSLVEGYNGQVFLKGMIHELGHAFGLPHQGPDPDLGLGNTLMGPVTRLYAARKYPKPDQVYLCEASAAMLWKHPIFAGTNMDQFRQFKVKLLDFQPKFNPTNDTITLSGKLVSANHAHSVVVIDHADNPRNEYWNQSHASRIAENGTFQITIKHPAKADGQYRILFCFDNGLVTGDGRNVRFVNRGEIKKSYHFKDGTFQFDD
jgi:hypothetical protein